ncbi:hypothetical protein [Kitasatospora sp. NPDC059599]|uniref:hypothetical protein n=1 Tax=Kitasatospora sp. NPDC059599 TaxID=3346880 RepID=UPI0036A99359
MTTTQRDSAGPRTTARKPQLTDRSGHSSDHSAEPALALLGGLGWPMVDTPEGTVHCTSPDGRVYVGWLPEDPGAWKRSIVWRIHRIDLHGNLTE